ncbi:MAG: hypothetical protein WCO78_03730 [Candidatus Roizmanbacteria bacterium]
MKEQHIPLNAWKPLPDSYLHFATFNPLTLEGLQDLRAETQFAPAVDSAWNNLAMTIDMPLQQKAFGGLKTVLAGSPRDAHALPVSAYWSSLKDGSITPYIEDLRRTESGRVGFNDPKIILEAFGGMKDSRREIHGMSKTTENKSIYNSHLHTNTIVHADEEFHDYVDILKRLNAAHVLTFRPITDGISMIQRINTGNGRLGDGSSREDVQLYLKKIWLNSDPYYKLSPLLYEAKCKSEESLFGDQADIAGTLSQTLVFPRISTLDDLIDPRLREAVNKNARYMGALKKKRGDVREPFYRSQKDAFASLIDRDYIAAASQVAHMATTYPKVFPKFAVDKISTFLKATSQDE